MQESNQVREFHEKFRMPMAGQPSLLGLRIWSWRANFMQEELDEYVRACAERDLAKAADALVDLCYVLHGTALMHGLPWESVWNEVHRANMAKRMEERKLESKRAGLHDIVKPEGWQPPDLESILGTGPWPVFDPRSAP